jgi:ATP-dependent DNA helicase RecG
VIAEEDLAIRGPGDFVGIRQAGVPLLSYANLARDGDLLELARDDARKILHEDPDLSLDVHQPLRACLEERWERRLGFAAVA